MSPLGEKPRSLRYSRTMDPRELRRRVGVILAVEVRADEDEDWAEVERLSDELQAQLATDQTICPEIVDHYLDDADVRAQDERYGEEQRERVRKFVETGEYDDGTAVPLWTCAVAVALLVAVVLSLLL
jgi:hypothetical protein